jgi:hypothetical protein
MIFNIKFKWDEDEATFFQTMIGSSVVLGLSLGAITAGGVVGLGRK